MLMGLNEAWLGKFVDLSMEANIIIPANFGGSMVSRVPVMIELNDARYDRLGLDEPHGFFPHRF
ncbi:MAG: hypothetical protein ACK5OB_10230 [Pirellula sp.]